MFYAFLYILCWEKNSWNLSTNDFYYTGKYQLINILVVNTPFEENNLEL